MSKLSIVLLSSIMVLVGCDSNSITLDLSTNTDGSSNSILSVDEVYEEWTTVQNGIQFVQHEVNINGKEDRLAIVKIDPAKANLRIALHEATGSTVTSWAEELGASVVINGGYFDPEFKPTTRTVVDGESYGPLLTGKTGIIRSLDGEQWTISSRDAVPEGQSPVYSLQSYPMLIAEGLVDFTEGSEETAQRSVVANDADGWLYLILTEYGTLTLAETAQVLSSQFPVILENALNLDGGTSSGFVIKGDELEWFNSSLPVASVLYIE